ncbi:hypothetical protein O181_007618 [Austropuccinia psidii MF-1]|uniref:Uncharacterized protein n=1 Tax=Austropuccinia psidii MF-1 TaxID=1389203 RepID=A0A9Q3GHR6_9BASI|nr:hypothetical protein [Austropuccinia psidii MF-1]
MQFELTFSCILEPSQANEPTVCPTSSIPGTSEFPASQVPQTEKNLICEPELGISLIKSMDEPFSLLGTPHLVIIIDNTPVRSPLLPWRTKHPPCPILRHPSNLH